MFKMRLNKTPFVVLLSLDYIPCKNTCLTVNRSQASNKLQSVVRGHSNRAQDCVLIKQIFAELEKS